MMMMNQENIKIQNPSLMPTLSYVIEIWRQLKKMAIEKFARLEQ